MIVSEVHAHSATTDHGSANRAHDSLHVILRDLDVAALLVDVDGPDASRRNVCRVVNKTCDVARARVVHTP